MAALEELPAWKTTIRQRLIARDQRLQTLAAFIRNEMRLREQCRTLRSDAEKARREVVEVQEHVSRLENEVNDLNAQLVKLYQERSEASNRENEALRHAQRLAEQVKDLQEQLEMVEAQRDERADAVRKLQQEIKQERIKSQTLHDELVALSMEFAAAANKDEEEAKKYQAAVRERDELLARVMEIKQQQVNLQNELNEALQRERQARIAMDIQEAAREMPTIDEFASTSTPFLKTGIPSRAAHRLDAHTSEVHCAAWHPSSGSFATGGADKLVRIWTKTGNCISTLTGHSGTVIDLDYSLSGEHHKLTGHSDKVYAARYLDSTHVVSSSQDRTIKVWNTVRGMSETTYMVASTALHVACHEASRFLTVHFDRKLREWDTRVRSKKPQREVAIGHEDPVHSLTLSPDRSKALAVGKDGGITMLDLYSLEVVKKFGPLEDRGSSGPVAMSALGDHIAQGTMQGHVHLWNVRSNSLESTLRDNAHSCVHLAIPSHAHLPTPNGVLAAKCSNGSCICVALQGPCDGLRLEPGW
ncbi:uncharacterized protein MONBRDRAFT_28879 [Monosiga brevicollis MX1]|uniref:Autophagy-related protein 16 domain-containing protein n=1 Tax=Monosiga brevicollis TaxID=81824 RepID=A9V9B9_MONBE|nr:uncharacterized protein MONBRDRAFT_28879 [Monosiga brevicollis MX1]EDQ85834.1 predicted protein [Monosiga brevicollis MX1]|eukprot:XP_001749313.1 hypothetical protein [Monosiga brevicollis MX1]